MIQVKKMIVHQKVDDSDGLGIWSTPEELKNYPSHFKTKTSIVQYII